MLSRIILGNRVLCTSTSNWSIYGKSGTIVGGIDIVKRHVHVFFENYGIDNVSWYDLIECGEVEFNPSDRLVVNTARWGVTPMFYEDSYRRVEPSPQAEIDHRNAMLEMLRARTRQYY